MVTTVAATIGSEPPVLAVLCDPDGDPPGLRMFSVVYSDAAAPEEDCAVGEPSFRLSCARAV